MSTQSQDVTALLLAWSDGDTEARDRLMGVLYQELRRLAGAQLRSERRDHTLQATALVNEAYLRLVDQTRVEWRNRAHFFAISARMMRRVLVDDARRRRAAKRGGGVAPVDIDQVSDPDVEASVDLVALDHALEELARVDDRAARVVEMRFFGGLTVEETAEALELSPATVKREWASARAWLYRALEGGLETPAEPAP